MLLIHIFTRIAAWFYPSCTWQTASEGVHLTFDDGPNPEITPWVLDELDKYQFKATFFCIGRNAKKHPKILTDIIKRGHKIGNHSYSHPNGFRTPLLTYLQDVDAAKNYIDSTLYRPPYGRIKRNQLLQLKKKYKIIMWTAISGDYSAKFNFNNSFKILKHHSKKGSIVVFHDSEKAKENLKVLLPAYCKYLKTKGLKSVSL